MKEWMYEPRRYSTFHWRIKQVSKWKHCTRFSGRGLSMLSVIFSLIFAYNLCDLLRADAIYMHAM